MHRPDIKQVKKRYEAQWLAIPQVVAIGIGQTSSGQTGIIISVRSLSKSLQETIPSAVEGIPIEVRVSGKINAL